MCNIFSVIRKYNPEYLVSTVSKLENNHAGDHLAVCGFIIILIALLSISAYVRPSLPTSNPMTSTSSWHYRKGVTLNLGEVLLRLVPICHTK